MHACVRVRVYSYIFFISFIVISDLLEQMYYFSNDNFNIIIFRNTSIQLCQKQIKMLPYTLCMDHFLVNIHVMYECVIFSL